MTYDRTSHPATTSSASSWSSAAAGRGGADAAAVRPRSTPPIPSRTTRCRASTASRVAGRAARPWRPSSGCTPRIGSPPVSVSRLPASIGAGAVLSILRRWRLRRDQTASRRRRPSSGRRPARTGRRSCGPWRGRAGVEGPSRRPRAAQPGWRHRRPAGRLRVGRGALPKGDSPCAEGACRIREPRAPLSGTCRWQSGHARQGHCDIPSLLDADPGSIEGLFQSGLLLALDRQFSASRTMISGCRKIPATPAGACGTRRRARRQAIPPRPAGWLRSSR